ncbi:collagenase-like [Uranotaenia lowii]|uniref:collagenase-like n=1 Tax=Uranotaenia lowii TaxID=190385 RepID=UPI00247A2163|nr:collagenase-like [Uranotaenia lowii]
MYRLTLVLAAVLAAAYAYPNQSRIVNGQTAAAGQFPYQAQLKIQLPQGRALCGGSLISNQWVLTAGHCVEQASSFEVTLGAVDLDGTDDGRVVVTATEFIRHEKYNPLFATNDVAVIKLPQPVDFSEQIKPIALPSGKDSYNEFEAVVSGWGLQKNGGTVAPKLQYATLKVISNSQCSKTYNPLVIKKTTICAQGGNKESPCNGDSGGPLVLEKDQVLIGVVSFGHISGCERGLPGAFARVTEFSDWIRKKTGL